MSNPFFYGGRITDPRTFIGRKAELNRIFAALETACDGQAQHTSIVGPRRMGKSSLLWHLTQVYRTRLTRPDRYRFVYISLDDPRCHKLGDLLHAILAELQIPGPNRPTPETFDQAIRKFRKEKNICPVLCLDEFEHLMKDKKEFPDLLYDTWRSLGDASQVVFLTASKTSLAELTQQGNLTSPFHNIFTVRELGEFTEAEAKQLLQRAKDNGRPFSPQEDKKLFALAGYHPARLQLAAQRLFDAKGEPGEVDWKALEADYQTQVEHIFSTAAAPKTGSWLEKIGKAIFIHFPTALGEFVFQLFNNDKASKRTAGILGWFILLAVLAILFGILKIETLLALWNALKSGD